MEQGKNHACFHMSYSESPNKSVVKDTMDKLTIMIATKRMRYAFLEGYHRVYVLITLLKADNPNIVPFHGPFHTPYVIMSAISKLYTSATKGVS